MTNWISVEDRLPDDDEPFLWREYLVYIMPHKAIITLGYDYIDKEWDVYDLPDFLPDERITHWMPLPDPPEE